MPHQTHLRTLGRTSDQRLSMLRNLAVAVLRYERVRTTEAKAKEVRRFVDRAIGLGRDGTLVSRRRATALVRDPLIVEKLFTDLSQRYATRSSGFTRLVHLGRRVGDGAPLMGIELVEAAEAAPAAQPEAAEEKAPAPERGVARARSLAARVTGRARKKEAGAAATEGKPGRRRTTTKEKAKSAKP